MDHLVGLKVSCGNMMTHEDIKNRKACESQIESEKTRDGVFLQCLLGSCVCHYGIFL
jgi:hypothetical protein